MKDGDDWELPADARIGTVLQTKFPGMRQNCDAAFAAYLTTKCAELLQTYEAVLRVDVDEFLLIDPAAGTWADFKQELLQQGYLYALGLDVIQHDDEEQPLDPNKPILGQRSYCQFSGSYCKPHAISRPVTWTSACHSVQNEPVKLSDYLFMFHLASMDQQISLDRMTQRGDFNQNSYEGHAKRRLADFEFIKQGTAYPLEDVIEEMRQKVMFDADGSPKMSPRIDRVKGQRSITVKTPKRFASLI